MSSATSVQPTPQELRVLSAMYDWCVKQQQGEFRFIKEDIVTSDGGLNRYIVKKLKNKFDEEGEALTDKLFRIVDGGLQAKKLVKRSKDNSYKIQVTRVEKVCIIDVML